MPDKKLTDSEIVKTLNEADGMEQIAIYCADGKGENMKSIPMVDIINLINRLQAENERLNNNISAMAVTMSNSAKATRHEAYKEFAEEYKDQIKNYTGMFTDFGFMVNLQAILDSVDFIKNKLIGADNLLKELVGENNTTPENKN